jgi:ABC-2 type transport system ATP-binding protein
MGDEPPGVEDATVRVQMQRRGGEIADAVRRLDAAGVGIADIAVRRPTLDDVFIALTGHAAEDASEEEEGVAAEEHEAA